MVTISCGSIHTVATTVKGGIMAWGGGIGVTPKLLNIGQKISSVSCSDSATLVLTQAGDLMICHDPSQFPQFHVLVDNHDEKLGKEIVIASVGMDHTVAITQEGKLLAWTSYPPHYAHTSSRPVELEVAGGRSRSVFVSCGAAHTLAIVMQARGFGGPVDFTVAGSFVGLNGTSSGSNPASNSGNINGYGAGNGFTSHPNNGNGLNGDTQEDLVFSDASTQQTIARLRSKLAAAPVRTGSIPASSSPSSAPGTTMPPSFARTNSLSLLSSKISTMVSLGNSRKLEDSTLTASTTTAPNFKRPSISSLPPPLPLSWKSSGNIRRPSDLDTDDVGLPAQSKHKMQGSAYASEETFSEEEVDTESGARSATGKIKHSFRGLYEQLRGMVALKFKF